MYPSIVRWDDDFFYFFAFRVREVTMLSSSSSVTVSVSFITSDTSSRGGHFDMLLRSDLWFRTLEEEPWRVLRGIPDLHRLEEYGEES